MKKSEKPLKFFCMSFARLTAAIKKGEKNMNEYKDIISAIVWREGGYREREIWKKPHTIENRIYKLITEITNWILTFEI